MYHTSSLAAASLRFPFMFLSVEQNPRRFRFVDSAPDVLYRTMNFPQQKKMFFEIGNQRVPESSIQGWGVAFPPFWDKGRCRASNGLRDTGRKRWCSRQRMSSPLSPRARLLRCICLTLHATRCVRHGDSHSVVLPMRRLPAGDQGENPEGSLYPFRLREEFEVSLA